MLPAAMPELLEAEDIRYSIDHLALELSPEEAAESFRREINTAHNATSRRIDNLIHNWKHGH